jgi:molybdate transport system ATP-binding protein
MRGEGGAGEGLDARLAQAGPIPLDAQLKVGRGELLALVGPSGSGKTTILRALAGLYRPRAGLIRCGGETWFDAARGIDLAPQRRRVGLVFQHYALFPHLTALGNVRAALSHLPRPERTPRAAALLARVGLAGLADRLPSALSGGEQQRIALARALAREPAALLLDEPFAALDTRTRRRLRRELAALHQALPIPIILVTHDLEEAAALGQRLCVLEGGRTLQSGTPREVMNRPATLAIARLLDAQNLFLGEVLGCRDDAPGLALGWRGRVLRAEGGGDFVPGERIAWTVPPGAIALSPDRVATENAVAGTIAEVAVLPGIVRVVFLADADPDSAFVFPLAPGASPPNPGAPATITFAPAMVHVMKRG